MAMIQMANVITSPVQPAGINNLRQYPKTGGMFKFIAELNPAMKLYQLRVFNITSPFALVTSVDINSPTPESTGEYSKLVDLPTLTDTQVYWFELGLKLIDGLDVEHRTHRVKVQIMTTVTPPPPPPIPPQTA